MHSEVQRSTQSFLRRGSSPKASLLAELYWNTGNHLHPLGSIYTIGLLSMPITIVLVRMHKTMHARIAYLLCDIRI